MQYLTGIMDKNNFFIYTLQPTSINTQSKNQYDKIKK